jgi:hypothetical protein
MALFLQLQLPVYKLNFRVITLFPKKEYLSRIGKYSPIFLLNSCCVSYSINFHMREKHPIRIVFRHGTIHKNHRKNRWCPFKFEFESAHDKVKWLFLQQALRTKGQAPQWCEWVARFVQCRCHRCTILGTRYYQPWCGFKKGLVKPMNPKKRPRLETIWN